MTYNIESIVYNAAAYVSTKVWDNAGPEDWIEVIHQNGRKDEYLKRLWTRKIERYV